MMTNQPELALLPCPFCGGKPLVYETFGDIPYVCCKNPDCAIAPAWIRLESVQPNPKTEAEAIAAWNRRHESSKSESQVTNSCPVCDARAEGFTDAEVEAACDAYRDGTFDYTPVSHGAMRAALEAARRVSEQ